MKSQFSVQDSSGNLTEVKTDFYIVGIGASAGGLEALSEFFEHTPAHTGIAFVIIQHLSIDFKNLTEGLLQDHTKMPVLTVHQETEVLPDHIYLMPNDRNIIIDKGILKLFKKTSKEKINLPIDEFFHSLGKGHKEQAIGIVLSGSGSDGLKGARTIKENGGMVLVQDPLSARFGSMPKAVIAQGLSDCILAPASLAKELGRAIKDKEEASKADDENKLKITGRILDKISKFSGVDFNAYRQQTIIRRTERRMSSHRIDSLEAYEELLKKNPDEVRHLFKEFLIGVTQFFRDPEAFQVLKQKVMPELFSNKEPEYLLRIWVAGCSTGEEAYSVAILLKEYIQEHQLPHDFKIFATDIDKEAIKHAGFGIYDKKIAEAVSVERLKKYFSKIKDTYKVKKELREHIVFTVHNAIKNPPFIKVDLISCRNLLIYLKPEVQQKLLINFHFALNSNGYLFLGPSESLSSLKDAFTTIDSKWNIYKFILEPKLAGSEKLYMEEEFKRVYNVASPKEHEINEPALPAKSQDVFSEILLQEYAPVSIFINDKFDVLYVNGEVERLLSFPQRKAGLNLLNMVESEESLIFRDGARKVLKSTKPVIYKNITFKKGKKAFKVNIRFKTFRVSEISDKVILIEINIQRDMKKSSEISVSEAEYIDERLKTVELELSEAKKEKELLSHQLRYFNYELQSSHEELIASNEELQSTNEELHSVNEELYTVNTELHLKIDELTQLNNDINNLLSSTEIGTVFLDKSLRIRKFTPAIKQHFNLRKEDINRPIKHFTSNFGYTEDIARDLKAVIKDQQPADKEITSKEGSIYLMRILPYKTNANKVEGLVITFVDISEVKKAGEALKVSNRKLSFLFGSMSLLFEHALDYKKSLKELAKSTVPVIADWCAIDILNEQQQIQRIAVVHSNPEKVKLAYEIHEKYPADPDRPNGFNEITRTKKSVLFPEIPDEMLTRTAQNEEHLKLSRDLGLKSAIVVPLIGREKAFGTMTLVTSESGRRYTAEDRQLAEDLAKRAGQIIENARLYSEMEKLNRELKEAEEKWQSLVENSQDIISVIDNDYKITYNNYVSKRYEKKYSNRDITGMNVFQMVSEKYHEKVKAVFQKVRKTKKTENFEIEGIAGGIFEITCIPLNKDKKQVGIISVTKDITEKKKAEIQLKRFQALVYSSDDAIIGKGLDGTILTWNPGAEKMYGYKANEVLGKNMSILVPPDKKEEFWSFVNKLNNGESISRVITTRLTKNKHLLYVSLSISPIRDESGKIIGGATIARDITKEREKQQQIEEREERIRLILESSPNGIILVDNHGKIDMFNAEAVNLFGYPREELKALTVDDLLPKKYRNKHKQYRKGFLKAPEKRAMGSGRDLYGRRKDGTEVPIEVGLTPLEINGETMVLVTVTDITERKRTEERIRLILESSPNGIILADNHGKIDMFNAEAVNLFGYSREELKALTVDDLLPEKYRNKHKQYRKGFLKAPEKRAMGSGRDLYGRRKDGTEVPIEVGLTPLEINGETMVLVTVTDISERKKIEEEIKASEKRFRTAMDSLKSTMIIYDDQRKIQYVNRHGIKVSGKKADELIGKKDEELLPPEITNTYLPLLKKAIKSKSPQKDEISVSFPKGTFMTAVNYIPILDHLDRVVQVVCSTFDITEIKKSQEKLKETVDELQKTNHRLEEFAYVATHDLKSPIVNMNMLLQLYEKMSDKPEQQEEVLEKIKMTANHLTTTMNDLVEVVALKKSLSENRKQINLKDVFDEICSSTYEQIRQAGVKVEADFSGCPEINYIPSHIVSIFTNLLTNAIKYRSGKRKSWVKVWSEIKDGYICIAVKDNGIGIDLEKHGEKLFGLFKRLSKQGEGKGIGLYSIKSQVEAMGGKVEVESEPDKGATFRVFLRFEN